MTEKTDKRTIEQEHERPEEPSFERSSSGTLGKPTGEPQAAENRENDPPA